MATNNDQLSPKMQEVTVQTVKVTESTQETQPNTSTAKQIEIDFGDDREIFDALNFECFSNVHFDKMVWQQLYFFTS